MGFKESYQSYISFSRNERNGLIVLIVILLALIITRLTMNLWAHPKLDQARQARLEKAWLEQKMESETDIIPKKKSAADLPEFIDLNDPDTMTLIRIYDIGDVKARKIYDHVHNEGPFNDLNELKTVVSLKDSTLRFLQRHTKLKYNKYR